MTKTTEMLASEIHCLPDVEKMRLVDAILTDLDKPDPEIDRIWAEEARKRWVAYKAGCIPTVSYQEVMDKHRRNLNSTMRQDPIVKEVRDAGAESAKKNHYNLQDLLQNLRDNEIKSKANVASKSKNSKLGKAG